MILSLIVLLGCGEKEDVTTSEPSSETIEPSGEPSGEPAEELMDEDEDGVIASDDCDDSDPNIGSVEDDADCDGVLTEFDCDDSDDSVTSSNENDADCDGSASEVDCDDNDATSTVVVEDADCDGILTADDCDDEDATLMAISTDADCDGILTDEDCDDTNDSDADFAGDCDGDGVPASEDCDDLNPGIMSTTTSADGCCASYQLTQRRWDGNADGVMGAGDMIWDYVYNTDGLLESETRNDDADNTVEFTINYSYNSVNQMIQRVTSDGWFTITTDYTYDGNGNLTEESSDEMSDGYIDTTKSYTYDGNNNRTSDLYNINGVGTYYAYYWSYNSANQMITEDYYSTNYWGDLEQQHDKEWEYTSSGLLDFYTFTDYYDGYADIYGNYASYSYNSMNQLTEKVSGTWDWCCSSTPAYSPTSSISYQYDSDGNVAVENVDSNNNGSVNRIINFTYNAQGELLEKVFENVSNPSLNYTETWTYDLDSNLVLYEADDGSDGIPDEIVEYIYECQ